MPPPSPRQQHALPTSSCDLHAAPTLPLLGDCFQQPFCRELVVRARAGAERTQCRSQTFQAAHALRKSAQTVRARPSLTEHVAPRGARRAAGEPRPAIGCGAHVTLRRPPNTHTHLRRPPAHENTHDRLSTPRAEYMILGAWGLTERVTREAPARTCRLDGSRPTPRRSGVPGPSRSRTTRLVIGRQAESRAARRPAHGR